MSTKEKKMRPYTALILISLSTLIFSAPAIHGASQSSPQMSPVTAALVVPDSSLLPGVPFDMWLTVTNGSDASVGVGLCADMVVKPEGAATFTIVFGGERGKYPSLLPARSWGDSRLAYVVLQPHQSKTLTLPVEPELDGPAYFNDARLSPPGKYAIALQLGYCWPASVAPQKSLLPAEFLGPVTTSEVTITRVQPVGTDAKVWKLMQELTKGEWVSTQWSRSPAGRTVINQVTGSYPDSNYFPYVVAATMIGSASERQISRFLNTIDRFPNSPIIDLVHLAARAALAGNCGLHSARAALCERETAYVAKSTKPTTRIIAFGREDLPKEPCPPQYECDN